MNEINQPNIPEAKIAPKKRAHFSFVWLIPLVAAIVGVWIGVTTIQNQGPKITIVFRSAEGLEAGKTEIRYNGVQVGTISTIELAPDYQTVIATARMSPKTDEFLVHDTKFWVVKPRISGANISGLNTLISGAYIGMEIGQSKERARHYIALDEPPLETGGIRGRFFTLKTPELGSLGAGTPIYFRRLKAGQVVSYELDPDGKTLNVKIFIQAPYDRYVTSDTRFWQASGVDLSLSATGLRIQTQSLLSILVGGIAFETPATDTAQPLAAADTTFTLFADRADAFNPPPVDPQTYLLVFKQSVRGLTVGAPVELGGVTMGEVTQISAQWDAKTMEFSVPVTISVDPQRYGVKFINVPGSGNKLDIDKRVLVTLVSRGLRAQLKTGSLISGSQYVSFNFLPNAPPVSLDWSQNPVRLPTKSNNIEEMVDSVASLLQNLDQTVTNADKLLGNANQLIEPNSELDAELNALLLQGNDAARSIRLLADYLERHPEALIRGKTGDAQ